MQCSRHPVALFFFLIQPMYNTAEYPIYTGYSVFVPMDFPSSRPHFGPTRPTPPLLSLGATACQTCVSIKECVCVSRGAGLVSSEAPF